MHNMAPEKRTMQVWADGGRWTLRGDEIDEALEIGSEADNPSEAWTDLVEWLRGREK